MRRLQRLHQIVEWLRARGTPATVAEIAERFAVSERTIFRDLSALRDGDIPLVSDPGPMGGVRLDRSYHLPPLGIAIDEAIALWIAAQLADGPTADRLASALDKVIAGIPADRRADFRRVVGRIVVGPAAPANIPAPAAPDPGVYRTCERALIDARTLQLAYGDKAGRRTEREVEPHGLLVLDPVWYLLAHDRTREATRTFRLDRIVGATITGHGFAPVDPRRLFPCEDADQPGGSALR